MPDYTPALTLWPEWAWAIDLPDPLAKRVECRSFALPIGRWIYLHAGKHIGGRPGFVAMQEGFDAVQTMAGMAGLPNRAAFGQKEGGYLAVGASVHSYGIGDKCPLKEGCVRRPIVTSAILGMFRVNRVLLPGEVDEADGVRGWKVPESYGNVFEYRRLNQPIPCKGAQGLWRPSEAVEMEIANVGFEVAS
jgi:hypothetical protein